MPVLASKGNSPAFGLGFSALTTIAEELGGMVLVTPTSIASTGTGNSSSIGANGSVTFSSCATLSLNGVFSATYDNYLISIRSVSPIGSYAFRARFRSSGVDNSTTNSYVSQVIYSDDSTVAAARSTSNLADIGNVGAVMDGYTLNVFGPYLAQPTALRSTTVNSNFSVSLADWVVAHNQSASYDGITIFPGFSSLSGLISVYGLKGA